MVVYGHQVKSNDDAFLKLAEECVDLLSNRIASSGQIWFVDVFPFCKLVFSFLPPLFTRLLLNYVFPTFHLLLMAHDLITILMIIVKYLPSWFPGASFKRNAALWKAKMQEFVDRPYEHALDEMVSGFPIFCSIRRC